MNSVKNLMIIAVLAAAGYGIYVSLTRNNVEPGPAVGVAEEWPNETKGTPPSTPKLGGSLPLTASQSQPNTSTPALSSTLAPPAPPPLTQGSATGSSPVPPPLPSGGTTPTPPSNALAATLGPPTNLADQPPTPTNPPPAVSQLVPPSVGQSAPSTTDAPPAVRNLAPPPGATAAGSTPPSPPAEDVQNKFAAFMEDVQKRLAEGKLVEAHAALSILYDDPNLPPEHAKQITSLLDQLAGTVIYSRQHYLEPAYVTGQGETIERIAQKYNVPWQLLARINGLMPPSAANTEQATKDQPLPLGMSLKVVRGPFDAVVRLDRKELTLRLPNRRGQFLYAGRFPIGIGRDLAKLDGQYTVQTKVFNPAYYGPDGAMIQPGDPRNPLRDAWIGLTDRIGIHGAADPLAVGRDDNRGTICVGQRDLQDLYGILSVGSRVQVLR